MSSSAVPTTAPGRRAPFGTVLTAMVTPFDDAGAVDLDGAQRLAVHLVDGGHDGLVLNGTTGESPTTSDEEKDALVRAVLEAVGHRAHVLAGVGTNSTEHTVALAREAEKAGAHGLLVVTPYYNRPPQEGLLHHFRTVADATDLPVMTYDIPKRTGVAIETDTLVRLGEHPRIVANKDAKGDLEATSWVLARSELAVYSGDDAVNLALLAIGGSGFVSVAGHVVGERLAAMARAYAAGDVAAAVADNLSMLPVYTGLFRTQGVILTKAALAGLGLPGGGVRAPLVPATPDQRRQLALDLAAGGVVGYTDPNR